ncbi:MAG: malate dehydrogenase [Gammaproteobacteria bacterium]|nr:malate dehydrogenase [Gammaproteobacteria bacterium]
MTDDLKKAALQYHAEPKPGKIAIEVTKPCASQQDLSLAYTPGVAEPCREIEADKEAAYQYTSKGNLVAVITDGTAVLGLGNIGALAGKPVMEGKAVLFKRFADIDCFDIEVDADEADDFVDTVARIASGFGGINLEDIAAPHCFDIEKRLIEKLDIPVFHDDQHGTAIIITAGLKNALELQGKNFSDIKVVCLGAGAAGIASMNMLMAMGTAKENILLCDRQGVVHTGRDNLSEQKQLFASAHTQRTLEEAMHGADVCIGVSGPNLISADMVKSMADKPIVFALSNPDPEISPATALAARDDLIIGTGRSDYPNQVNNVLGFPFIFRGALDVRASEINEAMKVAAVNALAKLAKEPVPQEVSHAYGVEQFVFGPEYIIPKPLDPRLKEFVSAAVADAAVKTGVAKKPYPSHYPAQVE